MLLRQHGIKPRLSPNPLFTLNQSYLHFSTNPIDAQSPFPSSETQSFVKTICSQVYESYQQQAFSRFSPPRLNLNINPYSLTHEQAISIVAFLANESGSMVALSFFYWALDIYIFKRFMRLYIVTATSLIRNGNFDRANEVMQCLVRNFSELGRLKEAVGMVFEMQNHGLKLNAETFNCILGVGLEMGLLDYLEKVFDEMSERGVCGVFGVFCSYKLMVVGYCRMGRVSEVDKWLKEMLERGFIVDNATCTLVISLFCDKGFANRALWYFDKIVKMGFKPNLINYSCLINGLCEKGSIKQAFGKLEEMVREGWKPNDRVTYTILITEQCKQANTELAMAFFGKMIKVGLLPDMHSYNTLIAAFCKKKEMKESENLFEEALRLGLVPTKETYTSMISGYCRAGNLSLGLKFFNKMSDHSCVPDSITYGTLINGLCRESRLEEACQLYETMMDKGLFPCEVTRLTLAYEYCKKGDSAIAMVMLERLEKKLWMRTVNTLIRKLCSEKKVGIAALFFHRLLDKDRNVNRVTLAAFVTACYETDKFALVSDLNERISKGIG
ncbi:hypothetical protein GOBAR_AA29640 [Gossypium barbadense]|uniref:Pentacotripeptide-repeat region of PRORP domain-containing protein n=1 Tax=Gossypium barbadense TaxID=3634 RepID=A0A2P5WIY1_GOSBA|nr:hypothetical protein GOBAR_AA29640 [Gossypium barbadense]